MKGGIMQPYFFPYLGYYQLAYDVEKYVFLDDVTFIKQGYINRNAILLQGKKHEFSLPVLDVSSYRRISAHDYAGSFKKFLKMIEAAYHKAPSFNSVMPLIESVVLDDDLNVARKNAKSLTAVFEYLGLSRKFIFSSDITLERELVGQERIIALCQSLGVNQYRNAIGGKSLYDTAAFEAAGIELKFIKSISKAYPQGKGEFVSNLSIIDVMMNCDKCSVLELFSDYELV